MKIKSLVMIMAIALFAGQGFAENAPKSEKFKVNGACGMCKSRIEKTAKAVKGVEAATWNKETKELEVSFDDKKTDVKTIQKAIAKVGHDTGEFRADDKVYDALPGCCHYEREPVKKK